MTSEFDKNAGFSVIIVAAGTGSRFGGDLPKQYLRINGKTVLEHTIAAFKALQSLGQIYVVINPEHQDLYEAATKGLTLPPPVMGGATRQESVYNALSAMQLHDNDLILIHDAARPCIAPKDIERLVEALSNHRAATLVSPVSETLRLKEDDLLGDIIDRESVLSIQTPQGFRFGDLKTAHEKFKGQSFTDDTSLVGENGIEIVYVLAPKTNIKITTEEDLDMADYILSDKKIPSSAGITLVKTGTGFDVHAFGDAAKTVRIGGIDIPHNHKLAGHSDADVVLHAITDALFGAIADGDIGSHFPPSDPAHKERDSAFFLKSAGDAVTKAGGTINHVDVTIICEVPKIGPHREAMRQRIAGIMGLPLSRVSVKATTTEGLGFTGRKEGIAAQAVATISITE